MCSRYNKSLMMLIRPPWNVLKGIVEVGKRERSSGDASWSVTVWNHRFQYSHVITSSYYISMLKSIRYYFLPQLYSYACNMCAKWMDGWMEI